MTIKETAQNYKSMKTLNVTDLDKLDLNLPTIKREGTDINTQEPYFYEVVVIDGQDYKIANPVLEKIQDMLKLKPDMRWVKVTSTGSGKATRYTVRLVE